MKNSHSQPSMNVPSQQAVATGESNQIVMNKLRQQNEKLRDELRDLTK